MRFLRYIALITLIFALSLGAKSGFADSEKLYPAEPLQVDLSAENAANPFVPILEPVVIETEQKSLSDINALVASLDKRKIKLAAYATQTTSAQPEINECKALIEQSISALPAGLTSNLDDLKLYFDTTSPRGLSSSHAIQLRCGGLNDTEIVSVFVHELGHIVDLGYFKGGLEGASEFKDGHITIWKDDPSVDFYRLSWKTEKVQKVNVEREDFVSGYAMTDAFEDFAESFNFYVLHGEDFRQLAKESPILQKKYDFFRDVVFDGEEFESERETKDGKRVWDTTLVPYDQVEFFARG